MATVTKNPGTGNGYITNYKSGTRDETLWDEVVAATGTTQSATVNPSTANHMWVSDLGSFGDGTLYAYRTYFPFDCTDLAGFTINSATLRIYVVAKVDSDYSETLYVVGSTQASYSTLATSDWSLAGSVPFSDTTPATSSISTGAYLELALNAAGRAAIASGNGRLALRLGGDYTSTLPATPTFSQLGNNGTCYFLAHGSSMPELVIDYTPASGSTFRRRRPSGLYTR